MAGKNRRRSRRGKWKWAKGDPHRNRYAGPHARPTRWAVNQFGRK